LTWSGLVWLFGSGFTPLYRFGLVPIAAVTLLLERRWRSPRGRNRKPCRSALVSLRLLRLLPSLLPLPSFPFTTACSWSLTASYSICRLLAESHWSCNRHQHHTQKKNPHTKLFSMPSTAGFVGSDLVGVSSLLACTEHCCCCGNSSSRFWGSSQTVFVAEGCCCLCTRLTSCCSLSHWVVFRTFMSSFEDSLCSLNLTRTVDMDCW